MNILKFITAGNVDDGKSTLIGRLLYDSKSILVDQIDALKQSSKHSHEGDIDLALLTDGLRAEREQGITIDVAYKYFSTPKRKFIVVDAPGHVQYTRNMITGASSADAIVVLIDASNGITEQTRRHSIIASLLKIPNVIVAINKIDVVPDIEQVFYKIAAEYRDIATRLSLHNVTFIPISALKGDNVVSRSEKYSWYEGPTLLEYLEHLEVSANTNLVNARFPVQYVIRPQGDQYQSYRGYAGKIVSGIYQKGDQVVVYPEGISTRVKAIENGGVETDTAFAPQSVTIRLEDEIDVSRGDIIVKYDEDIILTKELDLLIVWMDSKPLLRGTRYLLQINSKTTPVQIRNLAYRIDVNSLEEDPDPKEGALNDVLRVRVKAAEVLAIDRFQKNKETGSGILIDETSFLTVGAVLINQR